MKAKVTGVSAWQGTPTAGTLDIKYAARYADSSGNASVAHYTGTLDPTTKKWMDARDPSKELWIVVQGPDDPPAVRAEFYEVLSYGPARDVRTKFTRKLVSSDLDGLLFDYASNDPVPLPAGFGDAPLTMRAAQQLLDDGTVKLAEMDQALADTAQERANLAAQSLVVTPSSRAFGGVPYGRIEVVGPLAPAAVTALAATATSATGTRLTWTNNAGDALNLSVYRRPAGGVWETLTAVLAPTVTQFDDVLTGDGTYEYAVAPRRGNAEGRWATVTRDRYLPDGLVYWDVNEGAGLLLRDRTQAHTANISGTIPTWTADGLTFGNVGGYAEFPLAAMQRGPRGFWVMIAVTKIAAGNTGTMGLYSRWGVSGSDANSRYLLGTSAGSLFGAAVVGGVNTTTAATADASIAVNDNSPHFIEYQITAAELRAWRDGTGTRAVPLPGLPATDGAATIRLGKPYANNGGFLGTVAGVVFLPLTDAAPTMLPAWRNRIAAAQQARLQQARNTAYPWGGAN